MSVRVSTTTKIKDAAMRLIEYADHAGGSRMATEICLRKVREARQLLAVAETELEIRLDAISTDPPPTQNAGGAW